MSYETYIEGPADQPETDVLRPKPLENCLKWEPVAERSPRKHCESWTPLQCKQLRKLCAGVLLIPMATWGADSCRGSNGRKVDAPWRTEATRDGQAKKLNTITKLLLRLARYLIRFNVPWCLMHLELSWLFYTEETQSPLAHLGVVAISFDCCASGSTTKGSKTALFYGLADKPRWACSPVWVPTHLQVFGTTALAPSSMETQAWIGLG